VCACVCAGQGNERERKKNMHICKATIFKLCEWEAMGEGERKKTLQNITKKSQAKFNVFFLPRDAFFFLHSGKKVSMCQYSRETVCVRNNR
jgi:hypothetical protein